LSPDLRFHSFVFEQSIDSELVIACFDHLSRIISKPTLVVIDGAPTHQSEAFRGFFGNRCPSLPYLVVVLCEGSTSFQIKANPAEEVANVAQAITASFEHFDFVIETFNPTA
jgi:hypothetical protein